MPDLSLGAWVNVVLFLALFSGAVALGALWSIERWIVRRLPAPRTAAPPPAWLPPLYRTAIALMVLDGASTLGVLMDGEALEWLRLALIVPRSAGLVVIWTLVLYDASRVIRLRRHRRARDRVPLLI